MKIQRNIVLISVLMGFVFIAQGQDTTINNKIKNVNNIEIRFYKSKTKATYKTKKLIDLQYLKELITKAKNNPSLRADTTGEILYFKNKVQLFKAYFCTRESGSQYNSTGVIIFSNGNKQVKSLLNYGSGMLINEVYHKSSN